MKMIKIPAQPWSRHSHGYWLKKYHPDAPVYFYGYAEYNKWLKKNFNASDKSGKYIYFKTEADKFLYMTTFKTMPELGNKAITILDDTAEAMPYTIDILDVESARGIDGKKLSRY